MGEETARYLAAQGAIVVLGARRTDRLDEIVADIKSVGGQALAVACDVTKKADVENLVQSAVKQFGRIDVLINNAGVMMHSMLIEAKTDEWHSMLDINVKGTLYGIAAALPIMHSQQSGHIINLSSVAGRKVGVGGAMYSATKFAVKAISEGLRQEAGEHIRTTTLYPGAVASELKHGASDPATRANIEQFYAAVEIPASAIAHAIAYAISQPKEVDVNEITIRPTKQEF